MNSIPATTPQSVWCQLSACLARVTLGVNLCIQLLIDSSPTDRLAGRPTGWLVESFGGQLRYLCRPQGFIEMGGFAGSIIACSIAPSSVSPSQSTRFFHPRRREWGTQCGYIFCLQWVGIERHGKEDTYIMWLLGILYGKAVDFHSLKWVTQLMHLFLCALHIDSYTWMHHWFHESFSSYRDILMGSTWSDGCTEGHFGMMIVLPPSCWPVTSWLIERKAEANSVGKYSCHLTGMMLRNCDLTSKQMNGIWDELHIFVNLVFRKQYDQQCLRTNVAILYLLVWRILHLSLNFCIFFDVFSMYKYKIRHPSCWYPWKERRIF